MPEKIWNKFVKDIKVIVPTIDASVLNKLKITFIDMPEEYFSTRRCTNLLSETLRNISDNKLKVYIHLLEFKKTLKNTKKLKRKINRINTETEGKRFKRINNEEETVIRVEKNNKSGDSSIRKEVSEVVECVASESVVEELIEHDKDVDNEVPICNTIDKPAQNVEKIDKYISKLENVLQATKDQIERLEEQDMSLDELESEMSPFVMLDKLKNHYVKVWRKLSKLRQTKSNLRTNNLRSFSFNGSIHEGLNRAVEQCVRERRFPDYHDIRTVVTDYSRQHELGWSGQRLAELTIDIFTQIGNQLKKLRVNEFVRYFGNHLTDRVRTEDDPMIHDEPLRKELHSNGQLGQKNLDSVMESYSRLQQQQQSGIEPNVESESDISTETSELSDHNEDIDESLKESVVLTQSNEGIPSENVAEKEKIEFNNSFEEKPKETLTNQLEIGNEISATESQELGSSQSPEKPKSQSRTQSPKEEKLSEEYISEISSTTFQFNINQMKHGVKSQYYTDIIVLNSDEESTSNGVSSKDSSDDDFNTNYAYSSKLGDFIISKPNPIRPITQDIIITLDDDDDDDDDIIEIQKDK